jgi:transposase
MIKIEFTAEQIKELHFERFNHPHPRVQLKMEVLYLKSQNLPHPQISQLAGVCETTVRTYLKEYQEGGIEALKVVKFRRQESELAVYRETIREHFEKNPMAGLKQASAEIEKLIGIKRSPERVSKYLQREGLKRMKVGTIPAKADFEKQTEFLETKLEPRLEEAKKGTREVFF